MLLELTEGVLDPVLDDGDCMGDSLRGLCSSGGEKAKDFSLPVIASEMALRPVARGRGEEPFCTAGNTTGLSIEEVSLSGTYGEEAATVSMLGTSYSRLVTIGEPGEVGNQDFPI